MPIWSSGHWRHSNHVFLSTGCRMDIRLAFWDLCSFVPIHYIGRYAKREVLEGEARRKEEEAVEGANRIRLG